MNTVNIIGRFCKEMKLESSTSGTSYLHNSIAVDRKGKDNTTDFFNVTAFGKTAEFIEKYFAKGSKIAITGHLQSDTYKNKDGKNVSSVQIIIDTVDFCEKKESGNDSGEQFLSVPEGLVEQLPFE